MALTATDVDGRRLCDAGGRTVGRVTAFYRYPANLDAPWGVAAVTSGSLFRSTRLVDLYDATLAADAVMAAYPLEKIRTAPNFEAMIGNTLLAGMSGPHSDPGRCANCRPAGCTARPEREPRWAASIVGRATGEGWTSPRSHGGPLLTRAAGTARCWTGTWKRWYWARWDRRLVSLGATRR
jgi:hypothetical protein